MQLMINKMLDKRNFIIISFLVFSLSACVNTNNEQPSLSVKLKQEALQEELDLHVQEYAKVKPAIERLVALEGDLRLLMSQIALIDVQPTEQLQNIEANESETLTSSMVEKGSAVVLPSIDEVISQNSKTDKVDSQSEQVTIQQQNSSGKDVLDGNSEFETKKSSATLVNNDIVPIDEEITVSQIPNLANENSFLNVSSLQKEQTKDTEMKSSDRSSTVRIEPPKSNTERLFPVSLYTQCPPKLIESDMNLYAIHVASFKVANKLPEGWNNLVKRFPDLCDKGGVIKRVNVKDSIFFSLRVGPYVGKEDATSTCKTMREENQYCRITDFSGETL